MALRALQGPTGGGTPVGGTGTTNTIPRWTGPSTLGDSGITQSGSNIGFGLGASLPIARWHALVPNTGAVPTQADWLATFTATGDRRSGFGFQYAGSAADNRMVCLVSDGTLTGMRQVWTADGAGNVGIGTASPVGRTDIAGTSVDQLAWGLLSVRSSDAQGADKGGSLAFGGLYDATNSTHWAQISGRKENGTSGQYGGYLAFATRTNGAGANTERARIDSAGRLIVGSSTSPGLASGFVTAVGSSSSYLGTWKTASTAGGCLVGSGSDPLELWRTSGTFGAETYTKILSADTSNNLILNTANTGATIQAAGSQQGLKLPATPGNADTQTLDCYQDGGSTAGGASFAGSITLSAAATWGGTQPTITSAKYTRVGNLVFCTVVLSGAALTSTYGTTTLTIATLPTPAANTAVPMSASGTSGVGVESTAGTLFLPAITVATTEFRLSWFYAV